MAIMLCARTTPSPSGYSKLIPGRLLTEESAHDRSRASDHVGSNCARGHAWPWKVVSVGGPDGTEDPMSAQWVPPCPCGFSYAVCPIVLMKVLRIPEAGYRSSSSWLTPVATPAPNTTGSIPPSGV